MTSCEQLCPKSLVSSNLALKVESLLMPCTCNEPPCARCCEHLWDGWPRLHRLGPADTHGQPVQYQNQEPPPWMAEFDRWNAEQDIKIEAADFAGGLRELYKCTGPCNNNQREDKYLFLSLYM